MGKLQDILAAGNGGNIFDNWDSVQAAGDFSPLPPGWYVCRWANGELRNARTGTPEYVLTFRVLEGEHKGRQVWHSIYLTEAAKTMAKRDLDRLGMTNPKSQMEEPIPKGIRCKVQVTLRKDDNNVEHNRVRTFDVIGIDPPEVDAFAPLPTNSTGPTSPSGSTDATGLPQDETGKSEESGSSSTFDKF